MSTDDLNRSFVRTWLSAASKDRPVEDVVDLFEGAFDAMWRRAVVTLGESTLGAISDRVICRVRERHGVLAALVAEPGGLRFDGLRARAKELRADQIGAAAEEFLSEFLVIVGGLSAEILTPALRATIEGVAPGTRAPGARPADGEPS